MERGKRFYEWEFRKVGKKKGGAVYLSVSDCGEVESHEGYQSREEARKREKQERGEIDKPKASKPEPMKPAKPEIGASVAANPATKYFQECRREFLKAIGFDEDRGALVRPNSDDYSLSLIFAQLVMFAFRHFKYMKGVTSEDVVSRLLPDTVAGYAHHSAIIELNVHLLGGAFVYRILSNPSVHT